MSNVMRSHPVAVAARPQRGFTLIELLICCTIIGILASISVPSYVARRIAANETAVIAAMRAISQAQLQIRAQNSIDANNDGCSEYGTLGELAAVDPLRGQTAVLTQRLLSSHLGVLDAVGHALVNGYRVALYLPDASGMGVVGTVANRGSFEAVRASNYFTCLAWPMSRNSTGHRAFFLNQQGQVLKSVADYYDGLARIPPAGAALVGTGDPNIIESQTLAINVAGADGQTWTPVH